MRIRSEIIGCGSYLPGEPISNKILSEKIDTSDEWIASRTGIKKRHLVNKNELTSDLAKIASLNAIRSANIEINEIDSIILATTTPDETFPATATRLQFQLGLKRGFAFDVQAVCSGFVYALHLADSMIKSGQVKTCLVVGAEVFSKILDWKDRSTSVLFGDGAGAVVIKSKEISSPEDTGILSSVLHSDGSMHDALYVDGGVGLNQKSGFLRMEGKEVFKHAVKNMSDVALEVCELSKVNIDQVDWLVPHQANQRILTSIAKKLNFSLNKVISTVDMHANTSAASIPLALDVALKDGRIKKGDLLLLQAMGGGFTWGATLLKW
ncbi:ketoacyl-ACP synthase III [Alphaproteobacteria bacterium]|nr:ketoacyl-ACP synthase III [Alphaproteobacteria bacterium]